MAAAAAPVRQLPLAAWAAWLPLALPLLLVQTAAEELAFRGFLMQCLAARFARPLVWFLLPALLFGALHWNPAELGANASLVALSATVIGLVLADVTAKTGNLSAAIGLHFANNVTSLLVVSLPGAARRPQPLGGRRRSRRSRVRRAAPPRRSPDHAPRLGRPGAASADCIRGCAVLSRRDDRRGAGPQ